MNGDQALQLVYLTFRGRGKGWMIPPFKVLATTIEQAIDIGWDYQGLILDEAEAEAVGFGRCYRFRRHEGEWTLLHSDRLPDCALPIHDDQWVTLSLSLQ